MRWSCRSNQAIIDKEVSGLAEVVANGQHFVVVLLSDDLWQQLNAILGPLRGDHLPKIVPVVVLSRFEPPSWLLARFARTFWVFGSPNSVGNLDRVGVQRAKSVAMVLGPPLRSQPVLMDQQMMLANALVESRNASVREDIPVVMEMHNPFNAGQIVNDIPICLHHYSPPPAPGAVPGTEAARRAAAPPFMHPRYAAGRVISRVDLTTIFASAFYTPGVMEVMEAIMMPSDRGQDSFLMLTPVPAEFGQSTFGALYAELMKEKVMAVGLFRRINHLDNPMPYVLGFPPPDAVLAIGDMVYVQASKDWCCARAIQDELVVVATRVLQWHWRAHSRAREIQAAEAKAKRTTAKPAAHQSTDAVSLYDRELQSIEREVMSTPCDAKPPSASLS